MELSLINALAYFLSSFYIGYIVLAILLFLIRLLPGLSIRQEATNFLSAVNLSFSIALLLEIVFLISQNVESYFGGSEYEYFAFGRPYGMWFFIITGLIYLIGLLFLFKRFRKSWVLTLVMLVVLNFELFPVLLAGLFRDYLPSSWETYYPESVYHYFFKIIIFTVLVLLIYLLLAKSKCLPYPSSLIK